MSVDYYLSPIDEKPESERSRKGISKYEPIITAFLESGHDLVRIDGVDKEANYLVMQLKRVCKSKRHEDVKASTVNGEVYLEKI